MTVSLKKYNQINQLLLVLIACTIVFRSICTPVIIIYIIFNLLNFKYISVKKIHLKDILIISIPFILSLIFFFNNETISGGFKSIEKVLTLAIFPLIILTNKNLNLNFILNQYRIWFSCILLISLIRFIIIYPDKIQKYLHGIDLIEIGYQYGISLGTHAPALNMNIAFLTIVNFYFLIQSILQKNRKEISTNIILFIISFSFILIVNTRIALINIILCMSIIILKELAEKYSYKKIIFILFSSLIISFGAIIFYAKINPYMNEKYSSVTFAYMDKVGKLDEIKNPEVVVFNALVTRISIWKAATEVGIDNLPFGVGANDGKDVLNEYYQKTNQDFLAKYKFPAHNQFLDYTIKFGILGFLGCCCYMLYPFYKSRNLSSYQSLFISFGVIFFISNLTDDFLIRFDGIVFSGLFYTLFSSITYKVKT